jgi:GAF domain-containing protein
MTSAIGIVVSGFSRTTTEQTDERGLPVRRTNETLVEDGFQAMTSLSRALGIRVELSDVGSLVWLLLGKMVPCEAMALFTLDEAAEQVTIRYAAGAHAGLLQGVTRHSTSGIAGWVALNRRSVVNADPVFDLGFRAESAPALRSCVMVPLVDSDALVTVLALYSTAASGFTDDHLRLLEVLAPRLASGLADAIIADDDNQLYPRAVDRPLTLVQSN